METLLIIIFILGYLAIALEHRIHVDKAASGYFAGIIAFYLMKQI